MKKRRAGLMKKTNELSTLCGVEACVVVYSPQDRDPEVWPSVPEAASLIERFMAMSEMDQHKNMVNQESYLRQQATKIQEQVRKQELRNHELQITLLMQECIAGKTLQDVGIDEVKGLAWMAAMKMRLVKNRLDVLKNGGSGSGDGGQLQMKLEDRFELDKTPWSVGVDGWMIEDVKGHDFSEMQVLPTRNLLMNSSEQSDMWKNFSMQGMNQHHHHGQVQNWMVPTANMNQSIDQRMVQMFDGMNQNEQSMVHVFNGRNVLLEGVNQNEQSLMQVIQKQNQIQGNEMIQVQNGNIDNNISWTDYGLI